MKRLFAVLTIASFSLIAAPPAEKSAKKEAPAKVEETNATKTSGHQKGKKVEKKEEMKKTEEKK